MSVGFFMGIRNSYAQQSQDTAASFLNAIDRSLAKHGFGTYHDPTPDVYMNRHFGRSALNHHNAKSLAALAELAVAATGVKHLALLASNPYRVAFLPIDFADPLETDHKEIIWKTIVPIWVGSLPRLTDELCVIAPALGITL